MEGLNRIITQPKIVTEDEVRDRLKELEDYKNGELLKERLSPETKKLIDSKVDLDIEIEKLKKECELFDEANKRDEQVESLSKEKKDLEQQIEILESDYTRLSDEYDRRDRAGGGAHTQEIAKEMEEVEEKIKDFKEKLELIKKEL